jgi:hypothetical protein
MPFGLDRVKKVYHDDDEKGECFRKYKKVSTAMRTIVIS